MGDLARVLAAVLNQRVRLHRPIPHPEGATVRPPFTPPRSLARRLLVLLAAAAVLLTSACGFDAQTLQPYTPAMGLNADVGADRSIHVRNLLIVSRERGQGFVSASLLSDQPAALTSVSGTVFERDNTPGVPLTSNLKEPLPMRPGEWAILTERPVVRVTSPILRPGAIVLLELRFDEGNALEIRVPVYRDQGEYETISPIPRNEPILGG
jgi:hypothetical protein